MPCEEVSRPEAASPVCPADAPTSPMLRETSAVPEEASITLREISFVAAPCCSTAAAIVVCAWLMRSIVTLIWFIAMTKLPVDSWMAAIWRLVMSSVARAVWLARFFTSGSDDGEALAPRRPARAAFDRRVEREKIGLPGRSR